MNFPKSAGALAVGLVLTFSAAAHAAENQIKSVDFADLPDGRVGMTITMDQPVTKAPAGFTLSNPARIALDFEDAKSALPANMMKINKSIVSSLNLAQGKTRARMVINLTKPSSYTVDFKGNVINVAIKQASDTAPSFAAGEPVAGGHKVKKVDFQSGKAGEGRLTVDLSDNSTGVDVKQEGQKIILSFVDSSIADNLLRTLDVNAFKTPVKSIKTIRKGNSVRIEIQPSGLWEHSAYQTENHFVLEVKPLSADGSKMPDSLSGGKRFTGQKLSLNFQNIEVRALLQVIADFTKLNIVVGDVVGGSMSLNLKDVPWDQALDIVLRSRGLGMQRVGSVIWVAPNEDLIAKEKSRLDADNELSDREPLVTQAFQIKYQKAVDIQTLVSGSAQRIISKRGSAVIDPVSNTLFVQDIERNLSRVEKVINQVDNPSRQVMIESKIVIADDGFAKELGTRFGVVSNKVLSGRTGSSLDIGGTIAGNASTTRSGISASPGNLNVNLPSTMATAASIGMTLFKFPAGLLLNLELSAAESDNKSKTISSPRIITANQKKATIDSGVEIPYQSATSSGATSVSFKKATLGLEVTPQITPDDMINMELSITKDSVGEIFSGIPSINTRSVKTNVLVGNGETAVLGGVYEETNTKGLNKVPFFGDLPGIGNLFKRTSSTKKKGELIIFITPKIMDRDQMVTGAINEEAKISK